MRIGIVSPPWIPVPPVKYGGTELVVDLLARGLAAAGHEVVLWTTGDATCPVERRAFFAEPPTPIGAVAIELAHVITAYDQMRDVDIVHDHTVSGVFAADAVAPMVVTHHGPFTAAFAPVARRLGDRAALVAISHSQAATAGPGVAVHSVIHHGVDVERIPVGSGDGGYVAFLGRMNPDKGVHQAIDIARRAGIPIKVAAKCREDAEREYFETEIRPRLGADAEYLGELGDTDKHALLGGALALVNPIQWPEPFGLVMVEALACGTPVVATPWGAAPEIVTDGRTGYLRTDVRGLAASLAHVAAIDRRSCRSSAERHFSMARMVHDHERLYSRLVGSRIETVRMSPSAGVIVPGSAQTVDV